jgi:hypothetical protein
MFLCSLPAIVRRLPDDGWPFSGYSCLRLSFETDRTDDICGNWDKPDNVRTTLL